MADLELGLIMDSIHSLRDVGFNLLIFRYRAPNLKNFIKNVVIFVKIWFLGLEPSGFRCQIANCDQDNATFGSLNPSWLFPYDNETEEYDYCRPYKLKEPFDGTKFKCQAEDFTTEESDFLVDSCDRILYQDFEFESSFVTDNNLVCDKQFQVALVGTIYMSGLFFGSFLFGTLGDMIGRKKSLMVAIVMGSTFNLIGSFYSNYIFYCVTRFFTAAGLFKKYSNTIFFLSFISFILEKK